MLKNDVSLHQPPCIVEEMHLFAMIMLLVRSAIQATDSGFISINARRIGFNPFHGPRLAVMVTDTRRGAPPDDDNSPSRTDLDCIRHLVGLYGGMLTVKMVPSKLMTRRRKSILPGDPDAPNGIETSPSLNHVSRSRGFLRSPLPAFNSYSALRRPARDSILRA